MNVPDEMFLESGELAPHSQQLEEAVIGSTLINPAVFPECARIVAPADFYVLRNEWIWEAMQRIFDRNESVEFLTVVDELRAQDRLDDIGGSAYLTYLASNTATSNHAYDYARRVKAYAGRRGWLVTSGVISELAFDTERDFVEVENEIVATVMGTVSGPALNPELTLDEIADLAIQDIWKDEDEKGFQYPIDIMASTFGMVPNEKFALLVAQEGTGKTRMLLQWILTQALEGRRVLFFTAEESLKNVWFKLCSMHSALTDGLYVNQFDLDTGRIKNKPEHHARFMDVQKQLRELPLELVWARNMDANAVRNRTLKYPKGTYDMIGLDYGQRIARIPGFKVEHEEMAERASILYSVAGDAGSVFWCLAQYNREGNTSNKPGTEHIAKSDQWGKDADFVLSITRPDTNNDRLRRFTCVKSRIGPYDGRDVTLLLLPQNGTYIAPPREEPQVNLEWMEG